MADRFDKFTERARRVLTLAQEEAQRFNHSYIGTEHLLLGLVREGDGVAAKVLANLGVELNKVRSAVEFIIGRGDRSVMGEIGLTGEVRSVARMETRLREAARLGFAQALVPVGAADVRPPESMRLRPARHVSDAVRLLFS